MALRRGGIANPTDGFSGIFTVLFWIAFFAAGGYGVFWIIGTLNKKAESGLEEHAPISTAANKRDKKKEIARSSSPSGPAFKPTREDKPELDRAAADVNILVLAKEAARLKQDSSAQIEHAKNLVAARQRFNQLALGESQLPEVLDVNDEVLGYEEMDFTAMKPDLASEKLSRAISKIPGNSYIRVRVRRGNPREVILYFATTAGTGVSVAGRGTIKISNAFAIEVQKGLLTLPPDQLTDFERRQIEKILGVGEATDEEYAMLRDRLASARGEARVAAAAGESFTRQIERLNGFLAKGPVPEAILLKDGRKFTGKLLQDTPQAVSVRTIVGDITVAKEDVERLITAEEIRSEFQSKFVAGKKYREALQQLLTWTLEMDMPVHRELVAYTILQTVPNDPYARNAAGYVQMDGQWTLKNSIAAGAPIPERKAETKDDIRRELEAMGFVLRNNKWFSKVPWAVGIDSLYKPSTLKSTLNGTAIMDWHEQDTVIYRMDDKPRKLGPPNMKFVAPTAGQGLASILVEAPGEILECQVRASGAIIDSKINARIECFLTPDGGRSEVLYDINKGGDAAFHDVTRFVRGKQKFTVTARMVTVQDKYHTYARFLTSNKDSTQVFWVKGIVLKAAGEFDRVWANAR
jgi:hypothetical protein